MKENNICPLLLTQKLLSGKWSIYILHILSQGTIRFNELQRKMPGNMTHTTLSRQLKTLEQDGLIIRKEYSQIPLKVEYSLSDIGEKFKGVLCSLKQWGDEYIEFMDTGEHAFDIINK